MLGYDTFAWHRSFYDYIIRDRKSFEKIVIYIMNNPLVWNDDTYNYERREGRDLSPKNTESYKSFNQINQRFRQFNQRFR